MAGTRLLHVDSSARTPNSYSRLLGRELVGEWLRREPGATLTYRDLDLEPLPFVSDTWVSAAFTPADTHDHTKAFALSRSETMIREVEAADVLVIGAPMYNFGVPAALKAWIDQVVRLGRTFTYDGPMPVGLLHGKRAIVVATSGGDARRYAELGLDFRTSYLRAILGFIGITHVDVVDLVGTMAPVPVDLCEARTQIADLLDLHVAAELPIEVPVEVPSALVAQPV